MGNTEFLTILSFLIHEHEISFHLFRSYSVFHIALLPSEWKVCASFVKFIPKYLTLFNAIINEIGC